MTNPITWDELESLKSSMAEARLAALAAPREIERLAKYADSLGRGYGDDSDEAKHPLLIEVRGFANQYGSELRKVTTLHTSVLDRLIGKATRR